MKSSYSAENWNSSLLGSLGAGSITTCLSCSNGFVHELYGNSPVEISTIEMPKLQTSERTSYAEGFPWGSMRSGCKCQRKQENWNTKVVKSHGGCSHRHVRLAAGVNRLRHRVHEVPRDSKIAHLDVAVAGDENVRWLDISVNHLEL